jgi:hypothetical protein
MIPTLPSFIPRKPIRYRPRAQQPPAPTPPPTPAVVVDAFRSEDGMVCTLVFDQPVAIAGPFDFSNGAIQCSDTNPIGVYRRGREWAGAGVQHADHARLGVEPQRPARVARDGRRGAAGGNFV